MRKVFIRTFGCQMNSRDSEFVMGLLLEDGFKMAGSPEEANVIIFNSCSVRKHAEDRLFSNIANLKKLKDKKPSLVIGLIGCTAQNYKDKVFKRSPLVDFVCGPGNEGDIVRIVKDALKNRQPVVAIDKVNTKRPELFPSYRGRSDKANVSIGEGCNNYCSYCIVPYVRGKERYRTAGDILKEVRSLAGRGLKEIMLLGQNVNSYKSKGPRGKCIGFSELLEKINGVDGIERITFMTSHPKDASLELFRAMAKLDKVVKHLHLPLQSGSDRILKLMNRRYTRGKYLKLIESYRKIVPGGTLSTDIIVGFPTESDKDFLDTVDALNMVKFNGAFMFKYSPRPQALASLMKDDVPTDVKEARLKKILDLQRDISAMKKRR